MSKLSVRNIYFTPVKKRTSIETHQGVDLK